MLIDVVKHSEHLLPTVGAKIESFVDLGPYNPGILMLVPLVGSWA